MISQRTRQRARRELRSVRISDTEYLVDGGRAAHTVVLLDGQWTCDRVEHEANSPLLCSHIYRVLLDRNEIAPPTLPAKKQTSPRKKQSKAKVEQPTKIKRSSTRFAGLAALRDELKKAGV